MLRLVACALALASLPVLVHCKSRQEIFYPRGENFARRLQCPLASSRTLGQVDATVKWRMKSKAGFVNVDPTRATEMFDGTLRIDIRAHATSRQRRVTYECFLLDASVRGERVTSVAERFALIPIGKEKMNHVYVIFLHKVNFPFVAI